MLMLFFHSHSTLLSFGDAIRFGAEIFDRNPFYTNKSMCR